MLFYLFRAKCLTFCFFVFSEETYRGGMVDSATLLISSSSDEVISNLDIS